MKNGVSSQIVTTADRVCFFAHYHEKAIVADHVIFYLSAIRKAGFSIVFVSTSALPESEVAKVASICADVILRENIGLDFGSWIAAIEKYFPIRADLLLLANDSVYAPVGDLSSYINELCSKDADFYGPVESTEIATHLQSWFILLRPSAYESQAFADLMKLNMASAKKDDVIKHYEIGLSQALINSGLTYRASFSDRRLLGYASRHPFNYMHILWKRIVQTGIPFIKIELLRLNPVRVTDIDQWRSVVGELQPDLVPMIEKDFSVRGKAPMKRLTDTFDFVLPYWPELRFLLRRVPSRRFAKLDSLIEGLLCLSIMVATRPLRFVARRRAFMRTLPWPKARAQYQIHPPS